MIFAGVLIKQLYSIMSGKYNLQAQYNHTVQSYLYLMYLVLMLLQCHYFLCGLCYLISSQLFFSSRWSKWKFCILSQIDGPKLQEDLYLLAEFRCYCKNAMKALHEERVAELHSVFLLCHHICLETTPMKHHGKLPARLLLSHLIMSIYCPRLTLSTWITC